VDLRWLAQLDEEAIRSAATRANGKVVVAHEANVTGGFDAEIVARFARAIRKRRAAKN
jgi:pyruvate/2-oxoglutarate/acetoin dehydrogenase E1 component